MKATASFAAGFATGWVVRSTVDSSHEAIVKLVALCYDAIERARRMLALERERLDDLAAEARARARTRVGVTEVEVAPLSQDGPSTTSTTTREQTA